MVLLACSRTKRGRCSVPTSMVATRWCCMVPWGARLCCSGPAVPTRHLLLAEAVGSDGALDLHWRGRACWGHAAAERSRARLVVMGIGAAALWMRLACRGKRLHPFPARLWCLCGRCGFEGACELSFTSAHLYSFSSRAGGMCCTVWFTDPLFCTCTEPAALPRSVLDNRILAGYAGAHCSSGFSGFLCAMCMPLPRWRRPPNPRAGG